MNRKTWKQNYKRFGINKLKRQRAKLHEGQSMQRTNREIKTREESR